MAENNDKVLDTSQLPHDFKQTSDDLNTQNVPVDTTGSTSTPDPPALDPVFDKQNFAASVSDIVANISRERLNYHSQASASFERDSNATRNNRRDVNVTESNRYPTSQFLLRELVLAHRRFMQTTCPCPCRNHCACSRNNRHHSAIYPREYDVDLTTTPSLCNCIRNRYSRLRIHSRRMATGGSRSFSQNPNVHPPSLSRRSSGPEASASAPLKRYPKKTMYPIKHQYTSVADSSSPRVRRKKMCWTSDNDTDSVDLSMSALDLIDGETSIDVPSEKPGSSSDDSSSDAESPEDYNLSKVSYGLFGSEEASKMFPGINYFQNIPDEVKKMIFCQLNSECLFDVCPMVCRDWQRIICNKNFMHWKFNVHCYEKKSLWLSQFRDDYETENWNQDLELLLKSFRQTNRSTVLDLLPALKQHVYHDEAMFLLKTHFAKCYDDVPSPWALLTLLFIISDSVKANQHLLQIILCTPSKTPSDILLDQVYKIFYFFMQKTTLWRLKPYEIKFSFLNITHRLACTLETLVDYGTMSVDDLKTPILPTQQQSILKYRENKKKIRFTYEQNKILNLDVKHGDLVKITAYAGTGKTAVLVHYAKMRPSMKFLLVVPNKFVAKRAKTIFPENVHCTTAHRLAYKKVGSIYADNNKLIWRNLNVGDLVGALRCVEEYNNVFHCEVVLRVLERFFVSRDIEINFQHVEGAIKDCESKKYMLYSPEFCVEHLLEDAKSYWRQMINFENWDIKMSEDGYLKLYQIKQPQFDKYDVILIDDAEQMTNVVMHIISMQTKAKIIATDPHRETHSTYRNVPALFYTLMEASHNFYLTQNFRFGHDIACVAQCLLDDSVKPYKMLLGGPQKSTIDGKEIGKVAYISRCYSALFKMAALLCCTKKTNAKIFIVGGIANWGLDLLRRLCIFRDEGHFESDSSSRDNFVSTFSSYRDLSVYVKEVSDKEFLPKVTILETYTSHLAKVVKIIERAEVKNIHEADVVFSTAKMAKGFEFSTVKILDDFDMGVVEDQNLVYVAITRAKNSVFLNPSIVKYWEKTGDQRLQLKLYESLTDEIKCMCTRFPPYLVRHAKIVPPIVFKQRKLRLVGAMKNDLDNDLEIGGFICTFCLCDFWNMF